MLYPYQQRGVEHILEKKRCALWMDCGLGKTLTTIEALKQIEGDILIIAPKRVIDLTWPEELNKWWPDCDYISLAVPPKKRVVSKHKVTLINFELLPWLHENLKQWHYSTVVIDESTKVKSPSSKTFKILKKHSLEWDYVIELTGTPSPNGLTDLWSQMYLIDRGYRLGHTVTSFRDRWFQLGYMGWTYDPLPFAKYEIETLCKDVCLSMSAEDYLNLPEKMIIDIPVKLPPSVMTQYKALKKHLVLTVDDEAITAMTAAVLVNKLLQITSGAVYSESGAIITTHKAKVEVIKDILEEVSEPTLVVYQFKHELDMMKKELGGCELRDHPDNVVRWNKGEIDLMYIHPASAGHGLNLQYGGRHLIWTTPTWNLEHYIQTNARLHRNGQTKPVMVYRILAEKTIDQKVVAALGNKDAVQTSLLEALK